MEAIFVILEITFFPKFRSADIKENKLCKIKKLLLGLISKWHVNPQTLQPCLKWNKVFLDFYAITLNVVNVVPLCIYVLVLGSRDIYLMSAYYQEIENLIRLITIVHFSHQLSVIGNYHGYSCWYDVTSRLQRLLGKAEKTVH